MKPFNTLGRWIGDAFKQKFVNYPDVVGSFDILRSFLGGNFAWSKSKGLSTYQKSLYVFACVRKIAQKTASIDFELNKIKNTSGDKEEVFVHPALDLLYRPNPFQTKTEFYEKYMINKLLTGESFVLKVRSAGPGSEVVELWNLRPDYMKILIDASDPRLIKGYEFNKTDGSKVVFDADDIIHDAYPSPLDEFGGMSALQPARVRIETEQFASEYQANFFKNNARPDFILQTDGKIGGDQKDEMRDSIDKRHKGTKNAGKYMLLEGGLKYQQVSISQREMDYIEGMKFTRDDILVAFHVPKPIIAITEDVNYANANTAMEIFLNETIQPEIARLCEKLNEHLIYTEYGANFYVDYDKNFLPENEKEKAEIDQILVGSGIKLLNEAREERGMEPMIGGWSLYRPISDVAVGGLPQNAGKKLATRSKKAIFRGRGKAHQFLEKREEVEADLYQKVYKIMKKGGHLDGITLQQPEAHAQKESTGKGKVLKLIAPENREKYANVVNKQIDNKSERFQPEIIKFATEQKERVKAALADAYDTAKHFDLNMTKALKGAFDKAAENKILSEISFPFLQEFMTSAGEEALGAVNPAETFEVNAEISKMIKDRAKRMAKQVNDTTVDSLASAIADGLSAGEGIQELTARVEGVYSQFSTYRAELIARTEATAANNLGFIEGYKQSGVANAKEWIATGDGKTRDSHAILDGSVVPLEQLFANGLKYPGDPSGPGAEVVNCRCVLAPAFRE